MDQKNMMGDWEQKNLVNELSRGKELARQLQIHLNGSSSSSSSSSTQEIREYLVQKILLSYEKALSMLNWPTTCPSSGAGDPPALPAGVTFRMSESPPSLTGSPRSEDSDRDANDNRDHASRKRKGLPRWTQQVKVNPGMGLEGPLDDGFSWRKYGQKDILNAKFPRGYYRCTHRNVQGCLATKQVQRSDEDPTIFEITYRGRHTCTQASQVIGQTRLDQNQEPAVVVPNNANNLPLEQTINQIQQQNVVLQDLSSFKSSLKVITEGFDDNQSSFSSFHFGTSSVPNSPNININEKAEDHHQQADQNNKCRFVANSMIDDSFVSGFAPSFVSPATSATTNYFSMSSGQGGMDHDHDHQDHHHDQFGVHGHQNFHQGSESEIADQIIPAATSATNTPTVPNLDFPFGQGGFDSNFTFDNPGFFS